MVGHPSGALLKPWFRARSLGVVGPRVGNTEGQNGAKQPKNGPRRPLTISGSTMPVFNNVWGQLDVHGAPPAARLAPFWADWGGNVRARCRNNKITVSWAGRRESRIPGAFFPCASPHFWWFPPPEHGEQTPSGPPILVVIGRYGDTDFGLEALKENFEFSPKPPNPLGPRTGPRWGRGAAGAALSVELMGFLNLKDRKTGKIQNHFASKKIDANKYPSAPLLPCAPFSQA